MINFYDVISWCLTILYTCQPGQLMYKYMYNNFFFDEILLFEIILHPPGSLKTVELHRRLCTIGSWEYDIPNIFQQILKIFIILNINFRLIRWLIICWNVLLPVELTWCPYPPTFWYWSPSVHPPCKSSENLLKSNDISKQRLAYRGSQILVQKVFEGDLSCAGICTKLKF